MYAHWMDGRKKREMQSELSKHSLILYSLINRVVAAFLSNVAHNMVHTFGAQATTRLRLSVSMGIFLA